MSQATERAERKRAAQARRAGRLATYFGIGAVALLAVRMGLLLASLTTAEPGDSLELSVLGWLWSGIQV
jgi:hypothetical protein